MTDIERIDIILKRIVEKDPEVITISDYLYTLKDNEQYAYSRISGIMGEHNLADVIDSNRVRANENSRNIVKNGGYFKHLELFELDRKKEIQLKELEERNLKLQIKMNEWFLRSKWIPHVLSLLALIIALIAIVLQFMQK